MNKRTLARQKARNDNKARIRQFEIERHKTMNGQAPAAAQSDMEIKRFTEAEGKKLREKMTAYQEAANVVNEWLNFLKEQYSIGDNEGWQLGEGCFVRPARVEQRQSDEGVVKPASTSKVRTPRGKKPVAVVSYGEQDTMPATISQNGM